MTDNEKRREAFMYVQDALHLLESNQGLELACELVLPDKELPPDLKIPLTRLLAGLKDVRRSLIHLGPGRPPEFAIRNDLIAEAVEFAVRVYGLGSERASDAVQEALRPGLNLASTTIRGIHADSARTQVARKHLDDAFGVDTLSFSDAQKAWIRNYLFGLPDDCESMLWGPC
jgi:hypothetical protein